MTAIIGARANDIDQRMVDLYPLQRVVQLRCLSLVVLMPFAGDLAAIATRGALAAGYLPYPGAQGLTRAAFDAHLIAAALDLTDNLDVQRLGVVAIILLEDLPNDLLKLIGQAALAAAAVPALRQKRCQLPSLAIAAAIPIELPR